MKNPLGYIGYAMLLVIVFSIILQFTSRDYLTTFTNETEPVETSPPIPSDSSSISTERVVENPDGTKTYFVEVSQNLKLSASVSGQFFDSSKYESFVVSTIIQQKTFDILKDIWDRYKEWIALFVALLSIPIALLALITAKAPFLRQPFN